MDTNQPIANSIVDSSSFSHMAINGDPQQPRQPVRITMNINFFNSSPPRPHASTPCTPFPSPVLPEAPEDENYLPTTTSMDIDTAMDTDMQVPNQIEGNHDDEDDDENDDDDDNKTITGNETNSTDHDSNYQTPPTSDDSEDDNLR